MGPPVKPFKSVNPTLPGFVRSLRKCGVRDLAEAAIVDLLKDPIPGKYDFKKLRGYRNPDLYTITISGNHAYKMSMAISGGVAILRRVGTHKEIDDNP